MNIKIYCANTENLIRQKLFNAFLERIPTSLHVRANRYKSVLSTYNFVVARLLLKHGLKDFGLDTDLEKIVLRKNGKPRLTNVFFNISHSFHEVCCALSLEGEIGIDIEKINPIQFDDFSAMFSTKEWNSIKNAKNPLREFYWFWTRKESIIKASGLSLKHFNKIEGDISLQDFILKRKRWFLKELDIKEEFAATVCTEKKLEGVIVEYVNF